MRNKFTDISLRKRPVLEEISENKGLVYKKRLLKNRYFGFSNFFLFSKGAVAVFLILSFLGSSISFVSAPVSISYADTLEEKRELEEQLAKLEAEIQSYEKNIQDVQGEKKTLANEIKIFDNTIAKINLQIKAVDLEIKRLNLRIGDLGVSIKDSESRIDAQKSLLADSLKAVYENSRLSLLEILISRDSLSDFFDEVNAQTAIQDQLQKELVLIKDLKVNLEDQRVNWIDRREDQTSLLQIQEAQKQELSRKKREKDKLLTLTKGKEAAYQILIKESKKSAAEIRAQLYKLLGGGEISFGDALRYADAASSATGVRAALLLAVLDKESALGKNVGRCSWKEAMHPVRDQPAFLQITSELGINPDSVLVSCPIVSDGAYGGAMGISQFIPSTWMIYKDRVKKITGAVPSPWNPRDAFLATALYLADAGAANAGYSQERAAAARYYAGSRWRYYLSSYGDKVMRLADYYTDQINILRQASLPLAGR